MSEQNDSSINEQLAKLHELVAWFEGDDFVLEQAFDKFKEAEELSGSIDKELGEFKNKIEQIKKDFSKD